MFASRTSSSFGSAKLYWRYGGWGQAKSKIKIRIKIRIRIAIARGVAKEKVGKRGIRTLDTLASMRP